MQIGRHSNEKPFSFMTLLLLFAAALGILVTASSLHAEVDITTNLPLVDGVKGASSTAAAAGPVLQAGEKRILWDTSHGIYVDYSPSGVFQNLAQFLNGIGFIVDESSAGILNVNLDDYQIIVICLGSAWNSVYTADEVNKIKQFVESGGGLLIMGENTDCPNPNINPISHEFGTELGLSSLNPTDLYITNLGSHPIFQGISTIMMRAAGQISGAPPSQEEAWTGGGLAAVTVAEVNRGRVVVLGDVNLMDDNYRSTADNQLFTENVFQWLGSESRFAVPAFSYTGLVMFFVLITGSTYWATRRRRA